MLVLHTFHAYRAKRTREVHAKLSVVHSRHRSRLVLNSTTVCTSAVVIEACLSVESIGLGTAELQETSVSLCNEPTRIKIQGKERIASCFLPTYESAILYML